MNTKKAVAIAGGIIAVGNLSFIGWKLFELFSNKEENKNVQSEETQVEERVVEEGTEKQSVEPEETQMSIFKKAINYTKSTGFKAWVAAVVLMGIGFTFGYNSGSKDSQKLEDELQVVYSDRDFLISEVERLSYSIKNPDEVKGEM